MPKLSEHASLRQGRINIDVASELMRHCHKRHVPAGKFLQEKALEAWEESRRVGHDPSSSVWLIPVAYTGHTYISHNLRKRTFRYVRLTKAAHPRCLIRVFIVRTKKLCILGYPKCAQWRFWSDCANAQSDLNLRWAHISEGTSPGVAAYLWEWR